MLMWDMAVFDELGISNIVMITSVLQNETTLLLYNPRLLLTPPSVPALTYVKPKQHQGQYEGLGACGGCLGLRGGAYGEHIRVPWDKAHM